MAGITQQVDERIALLRKERAEMDALRAELEKREAAILMQQQENSYELLPLEDRKAALQKEIETMQTEANRLRNERYTTIENFGDEMDKLHTEKTSGSAAQAKEIQSEIAFLLKGKSQIEEELEDLRKQCAILEEKRNHDQQRIIEEKETHLSRARAEREASLQEATLQHSIAIADMDREKKALENEIEALEQTKTIEWNKTQAEIARYKTSQFAELDAQKELLLAEAEKEKSTVLGALRAEEKRQQAEIAQLKREWEKEELALQAQKRQVADDIKLLEYEYEKIRSENTVKLEKARVEELKTLEAMRIEALAKLEEEQGGLLDELKKKSIALRAKNHDDETAAALALAESESKRAAIINDIELLEAKFAQIQKSNEAEIEALKIERMQEVDALRLQKLKDIETLREQRVTELEVIYMERVTTLEAAREEKLEACTKAISAAEAELGSMKTTRVALEQEIATLRLESAKIKEENRAAAKTAMLERELEIERVKSEKMSELHIICEGRLRRIDEKETALTRRIKDVEEDLSSKTKEATETLQALQKQIETAEAEANLIKNTEMAEVEKQVLEAMENLSKMKLSKMQEIEVSLEAYKNERMTTIQKDFDKQIKENYKSRQELSQLNGEYNKRMEVLEQFSLNTASDRRTLRMQKQRIQNEIDRHKNQLKTEIESHKKEMAILTEAKDEQIRLLEAQIEELMSNAALEMAEVVEVEMDTKEDSSNRLKNIQNKQREILNQPKGNISK